MYYDRAGGQEIHTAQYCPVGRFILRDEGNFQFYWKMSQGMEITVLQTCLTYSISEFKIKS